MGLRLWLSSSPSLLPSFFLTHLQNADTLKSHFIAKRNSHDSFILTDHGARGRQLRDGGWKGGWEDGGIDGEGVETGGEEAESSLGTFRLHSREFRRGKWACVCTLSIHVGSS